MHPSRKIVSALSVADVAAVNFRVVDKETGEQINWCHHRKLEEFADRRFDTYEISEGAVAFRREVVIDAGLYPEIYFISHEGPDLALRIMDLGFRVIYNPCNNSTAFAQRDRTRRAGGAIITIPATRSGWSCACCRS